MFKRYAALVVAGLTSITPASSRADSPAAPPAKAWPFNIYAQELRHAQDLIQDMNDYGDALVAGSATPAQQTACAAGLEALQHIVEEKNKPPLFESPVTDVGRELAAQITQALREGDPNPCPTIQAYKLLGRAAFSQTGPLSRQPRLTLTKFS